MIVQRFATINDIDRLTEYRMLYLKEVAPEMSDEQEKLIRNENRRFLENSLTRDCIVSITVDEENESILSCAYMSFHSRAANFRGMNNTYAELYGIFTIPNARRRRYATEEVRMLLQAAKERGVSRITLEASKQGKKLYAELGFAEIKNGTTPMYLDLNDHTVQKQQQLMELLYSRYKKNSYTQDERRALVESGFSDCSSLTQWAFRSVLGTDIGVNTEEQLQSPLGQSVRLRIILGIPDFRKLRPGDCLFFRGNNDKRAWGVGHVEVYAGGGKLIGHGHGIGPSQKNLIIYCLKRYFRKSESPSLKNQGLIGVRRYI